MNIISICSYKSPLGELILGAINGKLCLADWRYRKMRQTIDRRMQSILKGEYREGDSPVLAKAREQLDEYFSGRRKSFDLPLELAGSDFQVMVWKALQEIPYGKTSSYQALADRIGKPNAVRAVANANRANALSIIVPCHRIIGKNGALVGYAGGLRAKEKLLMLENNLFSDLS